MTVSSACGDAALLCEMVPSSSRAGSLASVEVRYAFIATDGQC